MPSRPQSGSQQRLQQFQQGVPSDLLLIPRSEGSCFCCGLVLAYREALEIRTNMSHEQDLLGRPIGRCEAAGAAILVDSRPLHDCQHRCAAVA